MVAMEWQRLSSSGGENGGVWGAGMEWQRLRSCGGDGMAEFGEQGWDGRV